MLFTDPKAAKGLLADAAFGGRVDILRYLRDAGFDLNEGRDHLGNRPLDGAIKMGNLQVVEYLLSENVDTSGIDLTQPLKPWKGALPDSGETVMEEIRQRIIAKRGEHDRGAKIP